MFLYIYTKINSTRLSKSATWFVIPSLLLGANAYLFLLLILRNNVLHFILFTLIHCFNEVSHFQSQKKFWNLHFHRINLLISEKKKRNLKNRTYFKLVKFMCLVSLGHSKNGVSERIQLTFSEMISIFKTNQYREHTINSQSFSLYGSHEICLEESETGLKCLVSPENPTE